MVAFWGPSERHVRVEVVVTDIMSADSERRQHEERRWRAGTAMGAGQSRWEWTMVGVGGQECWEKGEREGESYIVDEDAKRMGFWQRRIGAR